MMKESLPEKLFGVQSGDILYKGAPSSQQVRLTNYEGNMVLSWETDITTPFAFNLVVPGFLYRANFTKPSREEIECVRLDASGIQSRELHLDEYLQNPLLAQELVEDNFETYEHSGLSIKTSKCDVHLVSVPKEIPRVAVSPKGSVLDAVTYLIGMTSISRPSFAELYDMNNQLSLVLAGTPCDDKKH